MRADMIFVLSSLAFSSFFLIVSIDWSSLPVTSHISMIEISNWLKIFGNWVMHSWKFDHLFVLSINTSTTFLSEVFRVWNLIILRLLVMGIPELRRFPSCSKKSILYFVPIEVPLLRAKREMFVFILSRYFCIAKMIRAILGYCSILFVFFQKFL